MDEFLRRLRERKLVQWSLAYLAAAFALIQVLDIVAQRFGLPEQTVRFVIVALGIGFFVTLVLAWYHGERGAQRVDGTELLILALLLMIGGGLLWRVAQGTREEMGSESLSGSHAGARGGSRRPGNDSDPISSFEWLDRAWSTRDPGISGLLFDPLILPYRSDPRFSAYCSKVGLPAAATVITLP